MNTSTTNQLFDLSYLNQVFQGNQDMINNIIQLFLEQVPQYIGEMEKCVERQDFISLHPLAHKAKSSIAMLGLKNMEQQVIRIEEDSRKHRNQDGLGRMVSELRAECNLVHEQLRGLLDTNQAA
jgi:HPt (histidine-containing phosphotransfer) domain-containing protein